MTHPSIDEMAKEIERYVFKSSFHAKSIAFITSRITCLVSQVRSETLEEAADVLKTWHIKKGGFGEIEHTIRNLGSGR